ncbi:hypothetical protein [Actinocrispum sp. NPDC049592]|uniref:hypothetical protein n=1 Tax=Actinocrispum sp. NPDC049592 TaxID=3154835 RepID=UPI00341AB740
MAAFVGRRLGITAQHSGFRSRRLTTRLQLGCGDWLGLVGGSLPGARQVSAGLGIGDMPGLGGSFLSAAQRLGASLCGTLRVANGLRRLIPEPGTGLAYSPIMITQLGLCGTLRVANGLRRLIPEPGTSLAYLPIINAQLSLGGTLGRDSCGFPGITRHTVTRLRGCGFRSAVQRLGGTLRATTGLREFILKRGPGYLGIIGSRSLGTGLQLALGLIGGRRRPLSPGVDRQFGAVGIGGLTRSCALQTPGHHLRLAVDNGSQVRSGGRRRAVVGLHAGLGVSLRSVLNGCCVGLMELGILG